MLNFLSGFCSINLLNASQLETGESGSPVASSEDDMHTGADAGFDADAVELALVSGPAADTGGGNVAAPASDSDDSVAAVGDEWGLHVGLY